MTVDVAAAVAAARAQETEAAEERRLEAIAREQEYRRLDALHNDLIQGSLRPASIADYQRWLAGWMKQFLEGGGDIAEVYVRSYPMPTKDFFVATRDISEIPKLFGAQAIEIIVPEGINVPRLTGHMAYGHCDLYFMDGFELYGTSKPSIYSDIRL